MTRPGLDALSGVAELCWDVERRLGQSNHTLLLRGDLPRLYDSAMP